MCCDNDTRLEICSENCNLRLLYFLQPYGSNATNVTLVPIELPLFPTSNNQTSGERFTFNEGPNTFLLDRANPFTAMLRIWTVRIVKLISLLIIIVIIILGTHPVLHHYI